VNIPYFSILIKSSWCAPAVRMNQPSFATDWSGFQCSGYPQKQKGRPDCSERPFNLNPGDDLRSHTVARAVSSAQRGLTSVFGMGTGVTLAV
jgi:hypothetical protein